MNAPGPNRKRGWLYVGVGFCLLLLMSAAQGNPLPILISPLLYFAYKSGASTSSHVPVPSETKKGMNTPLKYLLIVMAVGVCASVVLPRRDKPVVGSAAPTSTPISQASSPECNIAKKDGSMDERKCDLQELCKDWIFYRRKIMEYSNEGNVAKATDARASFNRVNQWLSAYQDSDVSACVTRNGG